MTKIKLELIPDFDMYILLEKGIRAGISYIPNRCSKANYEYLKSYDPKEEESKHSSFLIKKIMCFIMKAGNFT